MALGSVVAALLPAVTAVSDHPRDGERLFGLAALGPEVIKNARERGADEGPDTTFVWRFGSAPPRHFHGSSLFVPTDPRILSEGHSRTTAAGRILG